MHNDAQEVERRVARFMRDRLTPALVKDRIPLDVSAWEVRGEPVPFATAVDGNYRRFEPNSRWGKPWGTTWFRFRAETPAGWSVSADEGLELSVDLGFSKHRAGFQAEGLLYDTDGRPLKAINPLNTQFDLLRAGFDHVDFYLEAASNPDFDIEEFEFAPTLLGDKLTAGDKHLYRLGEVSLQLRDRVAWELVQDVRVLTGLLDVLPEHGTRRARIVQSLYDMLAAIDPHDISSTAGRARDALKPVLASPATASAHAITATGHAHIDSAWLWPVRETIRKCARSFSNVLDLMDSDPEFVFAASSAQQYVWMKEFYPAIYARIGEKVAAGQWIPVGGMWVESDTNLPGGEALARQFLEGASFFRDEFGMDCPEVWLPDSFGYSGSLPQIAASAGARWMLTQKMSWNDTNSFPHHTFLWEGIDGTSLFTHLPPVDTYGSELTAKELAHAEANFSEKRHASRSLVPFGYGDGGGGPTREMLAAAHRLKSLEGSPTVTLGSPREFFTAAEEEYDTPATWVGEMYLEGHRGTLTSQAKTKRGNRESEHLLREAELWAATATVLHGADYPYDALRDAWREVLLLQFHDILPGSAIAWVHQEAEAAHRRIRTVLTGLIESALQTLAGPGDLPLVANARPLHAGIAAGAIGITPETRGRSSLTVVDDRTILDNGLVRAVIDARGLLVSLTGQSGRDVVSTVRPVGLLQLHRDVPSQWDAWDIEQHYRDHTIDLDAVESLELQDAAPDVAVIVTRRQGESTFTQTYRLRAGSPVLDIDVAVDWHERERMLKLALPFDIRADQATSETQFGHVHRGTHSNTSWDNARFETVAHRWVHVGEPGAGVAIANDATYGWDISRSTVEQSHSSTVVRASLLRSPLFPDPQADQGEHEFRFTVRPDAGIPDAIEDGYALNLPLRALTGRATVDPLVSVHGDGVIVESVKLAHDRSGDVIVRLYEALGARRRAVVSWSFDASHVATVGILEDANRAATMTSTPEGAEVQLRPFELITLRISP